MSSSHDYNTRSKEMSDYKMLDEISKLGEELVESFKRSFTDIKDEINLKVLIKRLQNEITRLNDVVNQLHESIVSLESKSNSVERYGRQNNMEIDGIPNSISDDNLESTVFNVPSKATNVHVTTDDTEACHMSLNMVDSNKLFSNANVEKQVNILNDTLFNIFSNFVRSKAITINDRDPPWINEEIKCKIKSKNKTFQQYLKNGRKITDLKNVNKEAAELSEMIQLTYQ